MLFYGTILINIPKLFQLPLFISSTAADSSKEIPHIGNYITVIKPIITEGVLCIVENICL